MDPEHKLIYLKSQTMNYHSNYAIDSAHLHFAANWLKSHKSMDQKDQMLDELIIRRLERASNQCMKQALDGYKLIMEAKDEGEVKMIETINNQIK